MEKKTLWYTIQQWRNERTLANEQGHASPPFIDVIPEDEEITLFDLQRVPYTPEDYDYTPSITQEWQDADPAQDRIDQVRQQLASISSRIEPSS